MAKPNYFTKACSWADDRFGLLEASRNRYRLAFVLTLFLNAMLALAITMMMPLKKTEPLLIHHYDSGVVTVEPIKDEKTLINQAQIESDLVRYVVNRESFDVSSYRAQYELVNLLSDPEVASSYENLQRRSNPKSPLNELGTEKTRQVHIYSINFIDRESLNSNEQKTKDQNHYDLAEVVFSLTDKNKNGGTEVTQHFSALISWRYLGMPSSPEARWKNFSGFEITRYTLQQRNV